MRKENFLKEKTSLSCFLFNFPFPLLVVVARVQNISFTSRTSEVFCTLSTKRLMSLGSCLFLFFGLCLLKLGVIGFCILQSDYRIQLEFVGFFHGSSSRLASITSLHFLRLPFTRIGVKTFRLTDKPQRRNPVKFPLIGNWNMERFDGFRLRVSAAL